MFSSAFFLQESTADLVARLKRCGFKDVESRHLFTSLTAARNYVRREKLQPLLLLEDSAAREFNDDERSDKTEKNCVLVGLAPSKFGYDHMNAAFRILAANQTNRILAVHKGRYFRREDGLALGPGPFVEALKYASGTKTHVVGKPSVAFFKEALASIHADYEHMDEISPDRVFMIGDDVRDDVQGALNAGFNAILVKTGKYREGWPRK